MAEKDYSPLSIQVVRGLNDKLYEKRKSAALEIERYVLHRLNFKIKIFLICSNINSESSTGYLNCYYIIVFTLIKQKISWSLSFTKFLYINL